MKKVLYIAAVLFSQLIFSQGVTEICNNGIDDDGDGLTDINDPDCVCHIESLISNNSFETYNQCPNAYGQLDKSSYWIHGNGSSSDYLNSCGFILEDLETTGLYPFPHGNGVAGGAFLNDYKEYISTCLSQPLEANVNYRLKFYVSCFQLKNTNYSPTGKVCDNLMNFEPVAITLYGNTNCSNFSFSVNGPSSNGWEVLGTITYTPVMEWAEVTIDFTPQNAVRAISLGAPLGILPPSYPTFSTIAPASQCSPYFLYDDLVLNETSIFETNNGNICYNGQLLTANPSFTVTGAVTYQWYYNGIAIAGATAAQYTIPQGSQLDEFTVKIIDTDNCAILSVFDEVTPPPSFSQTGCDTLLTAETGMAPYQWYLDNIAITGATAQQFTPTASGNYTVTGTRPCGVTRMSQPVAVTVCSDMAVTKEITDVVNGLITFKITAKNLGPQNNTEVSVTDLLPTGYTYASNTTTTGNYNTVNGIWDIGNLTVGSEAVIYISAEVNTTGIHTNTATITGRNTDTDLNNNTAQATPDGKMYLSKEAQEHSYYSEGEVIIYNLELTNTGNVTLHNIVLADVNADAGSISPSVITSLAPGSTILVTAKHTITAADVADGRVVNQATAIGESFNGLYVKTISDDPTTLEVQDATLTIIDSMADLSVTKTDGRETYMAGDTLMYTITVTNNGPSLARDVYVEDQLPQGITIMQWMGNNQTRTGALQQTIPVLTAGQSVIFTVTITVPKNFEGNLINTATTSSSVLDLQLNNNSATDIDLPCDGCIIPKGISPNNDTYNDVFDLSFLSDVTKLEIFNRYGQKVYSQNNYTNQWKGQGDDDKELPTGTYYYVIYFETRTAQSGWVYINR